MLTLQQLCTSLGNEFHNFNAETLSSDLNASKNIINMIQTHLLKQSYMIISSELFKSFNRFRGKEIVEGLIVWKIYIDLQQLWPDMLSWSNCQRNITYFYVTLSAPISRKNFCLRPSSPRSEFSHSFAEWTRLYQRERHKIVKII